MATPLVGPPTPDPAMLAILRNIASQKAGGDTGALNRAMNLVKGKQFPPEPPLPVQPLAH